MGFSDSVTDAHFDALAETLSDALVVIDSRNRIRFANPALDDLLGYLPEEVEGELLTVLMPERLEDRHLEAVDRYLTTGERTLDWEGVELQGRHRDGHEVPLSVSFSEFTLDDERYFTGVLRDVSARRELESERDLLRAAKDAIAESAGLSEGLTSDILRTIPTGVTVLDVRGEFEYANEQAEELLRIEPDEQGRYPSPGEIPLALRDVDGNALSDAEHPYRAVLRGGEETTRDIGVEYSDGERRWLSVHGTPLRGPDGDVTKAMFALEDVTDRVRQADRLERLNEVAQELTEVESFDAACERAVTAARDVLGLPITSIERYDPESGRLEPCAHTPEAVDLVGDGPLLAAERDPTWQAFVGNEARVYDDLEAEAGVDAEETPLSSAIVLPLDEYGVFVSGATEPDAHSETDVRLAKTLAGNVTAAFHRLDREMELREQKSELKEKNEQLQRVQRVNREIRDITQALMGATSKDEIKRLVVDRLANSDPYRFVWFGERDFATDSIVASASAGVEEGYLDAVEVTADTSETGQGPAGRAIRTGEPQIQNDLRSDPPFEPWRQEAMQRGYRASIAVPVMYNETVYGLLNLYANEPGVFTEMEAAVLAELGEVIGYALNAMERYNALVSEESIELEFLIRDFSDPLMSLLRERGGSARLEHLGNREAGSLRVFVAFSGLDFEAIDSFSRERLGGKDLTLVRNRDGELIVEIHLPNDSFLVSLIDRGAIPTDISATPDEGRTTVRIPKSASVREYVELFRDRYGDEVELVARRDSSDPVRTQAEFERAYVDRLTERQREVLQTAYFAGYFEQPRKNSAREIADMLSVSQPTVSRHLRNSQQTLFSLLFGDDGSG
ncbi:PAS domain S-box protein [Halorubrum sp. CSM-61]|uniref:PAS domain S-box protein n=1 Tax=Halorubrum sp. CSM-61 TaxID=2485838 RepID=UPI000F4CD9C9|nr:PAS domain S-box protein [Halorubrum sp. CSM-61]